MAARPQSNSTEKHKPKPNTYYGYPHTTYTVHRPRRHRHERYPPCQETHLRHLRRDTSDDRFPRHRHRRRGVQQDTHRTRRHSHISESVGAAAHHRRCPGADILQLSIELRLDAGLQHRQPERPVPGRRPDTLQRTLRHNDARGRCGRPHHGRHTQHQQCHHNQQHRLCTAVRRHGGARGVLAERRHRSRHIPQHRLPAAASASERECKNLGLRCHGRYLPRHVARLRHASRACKRARLADRRGFPHPPRPQVGAGGDKMAQHGAAREHAPLHSHVPHRQATTYSPTSTASAR